MIWEKDPVRVLQLLFNTKYRRSLALGACHITAASGAVVWILYVQLSSEFSGKHCTVVETSAAGEGMEQPGDRSCWSRRRDGSFEIPAQNQSWKHSVLSVGFGAQCQSSCQKAKLGPGDGPGVTAFSCGVLRYQLH